MNEIPLRAGMLCFAGRSEEDVLALVTPVDYVGASIIARPQRRLQRLWGRALIRRLLAEVTGGDGKSWRIDLDGQGRPIAVDPDGIAGPDISIAHSGDRVAAVVARQGRVGIDIELPRQGRDSGALARSYFSGQECAAVAAHGEAALLAFWTLREALAKAVGGGVALALGLNGSDLLRARAGSATVRVENQLCVVGHTSLGENQLALAWVPPSGTVDSESILVTALGDARCNNQFPT